MDTDLKIQAPVKTTPRVAVVPGLALAKKANELQRQAVELNKAEAMKGDSAERAVREDAKKDEPTSKLDDKTDADDMPAGGKDPSKGKYVNIDI